LNFNSDEWSVKSDVFSFLLSDLIILMNKVKVQIEGKAYDVNISNLTQILVIALFQQSICGKLYEIRIDKTWAFHFGQVYVESA
jgi:hypothetical protein